MEREGERETEILPPIQFYAFEYTWIYTGMQTHVEKHTHTCVCVCLCECVYMYVRARAFEHVWGEEGGGGKERYGGE